MCIIPYTIDLRYLIFVILEKIEHSFALGFVFLFCSEVYFYFGRFSSHQFYNSIVFYYSIVYSFFFFSVFLFVSVSNYFLSIRLVLINSIDLIYYSIVSITLYYYSIALL
jgi:hypothetical protein